MTDLSDFGVDVDEPADQPEPEPVADQEQDTGPSYPNGRCPAINRGDRHRCASPVSRMKASDGFCGTHGRASDPWSIHDDPDWLIRVTGGQAARCRAIEHGGDRCTNACDPLKYFCGLHTDWPHETVDELEEGELDVDLIREALEAVQEVPVDG